MREKDKGNYVVNYVEAGNLCEFKKTYLVYVESLGQLELHSKNLYQQTKTKDKLLKFIVQRVITVPK